MAYTTKDWGGAFSEVYNNRTSSETASGTQADEVARERYLAAMRSPAPVQWYSDHLREDQRFRGVAYVAMKVLMDQAASAEVKFWRWDEDARLGGDQDGKTPLPRTHPACRLFHRPNKQDSGAMLRRRQVQQLCLTGSSLNWRVDNGFAPQELWCVPTGTYQPVAISAQYPDGAYRVMPWFPGPLAMVPGVWNAGGVVVDARNMMTIRLPHPLVYQEGQSPLQACDLALDTIDSIDRARFSTMRRGINPGAVLESTDPNVKYPTDAELVRIRQQILQLVGGPDKAGQVATLGAGQTLKPYQPTNVEVGWIESWSQLTSFVLSIFGVTKSLAFMSEDTTFAALYAALKQFNLFSLCPLLGLMTDSYNHQIIHPFFGEDVWMELEPKRIDNEELTEQQISNDLKCGARLLNEIRTLRGLPEVPWGNERAWDTRAKGENPELPEHHADEESTGDPEMEERRPENRDGRGSLGPRLIVNGR